MKRTGRVILILSVIIICMAGLWLFQSWRDAEKTESGKTFRNVYVMSASGGAVTAVADGKEQTWGTLSPLTDEKITGIADVSLRDGRVVRITKKPENIKGKILRLTENSVTLGEYGEVELDSDFVVYRMSKKGKVSQGQRADIMLGAADIQFSAAGDKVCAAVVPETKPDNIRVLLKDSNFSSYDMEKVVVSAMTDLTVRSDGEDKRYKKGQKVTLKPGDVKERVTISAADGGRVRVETLKRQYGVPEYRGKLEVVKKGKSLLLINELPLEEYLYSVVPSEMPTEYSMEALKAQAVCARSYAEKQMRGRRLAAYGAHVDDSVSFQVYNNLREDARAVSAVNATRNQVAAYKGKTASTYFYSASCGSTSGMKDVWFTKKEEPYLRAALQTWPRSEKNLSAEKDFAQFIKEAPESLDSSSPWYRWQASVSSDGLKKTIEANLAKRYEANPTQIQVRGEDGVYRSRRITEIGEVRDVAVRTRGAGGIASMAEVSGTKATIRIYTEYNLRILLAGENMTVTRKDKKKVTGLKLLPSGFFCVEKKENRFLFRGGGYGHGVGLSQNGADALAKQGKKYGEILTFYFPGTSVADRESL